MEITRVIVDKFDDIEFRASGNRIPAEVTVTLSWDGQTRELDLTKEHKEHIDDLLAPYITMGRPIKTGEPRATRQRRNVIRNRAMRRFSDENITEHPAWSYTKQDDGTYSHSKALRDAFAEHEAALAGRTANAVSASPLPE
jgi:hypothetical protein